MSHTDPELKENESIYNLNYVSQRFAKNIADATDNALFGYVAGVVHLLETQGKDITQYAIINVSNPMEYKDDGFRVNMQWRVVPISDLKNLPTYEEDEL